MLTQKNIYIPENTMMKLLKILMILMQGSFLTTYVKSVIHVDPAILGFLDKLSG